MAGSDYDISKVRVFVFEPRHGNTGFTAELYYCENWHFRSSIIKIKVLGTFPTAKEARLDLIAKGYGGIGFYEEPGITVSQNSTWLGD